MHDDEVVLRRNGTLATDPGIGILTLVKLSKRTFRQFTHDGRPPIYLAVALPCIWLAVATLDVGSEAQRDAHFPRRGICEGPRIDCARRVKHEGRLHAVSIRADGRERARRADASTAGDVPILHQQGQQHVHAIDLIVSACAADAIKGWLLGGHVDVKRGKVLRHALPDFLHQTPLRIREGRVGIGAEGSNVDAHLTGIEKRHEKMLVRGQGRTLEVQVDRLERIGLAV